MKIVSESELKEHNNATIKGAVEGAALGSAIALPSFWLLNKRWPYYRQLPLPLKAFGAVIVIAPLISIRAEHAGLEYERSKWTGVGKMEIDRQAEEENRRWASLGMKDKAAEWAANHQLSVISGTWALSVAAIGSYIMKDPLQTTPQKVVQVRVWAQGITIGVLIAAAVFTHAQRREAAANKTKNNDHTWAHVIEEQQRAKENAKAE
ncbi:mitochondrion protein [Coniophora puteana RWD-64-598 SS2]|uniref:Mitochondrion protein n=1 Tax=Coniophora puteana (strain RWD-64-598) TaxID=741705 RepID=A0A5M3MSW9_CONPW|nr:mitochondrion protein [Coniophora puteana RWD-64-598 SS2]EIW82262.1 mitochondrion protein [Coniophora puteana RWD-64-598 SS2]